MKYGVMVSLNVDGCQAKGKVVKVYKKGDMVPLKDMQIFWQIKDGEPGFETLTTRPRKLETVVFKPDDREGYVIAPSKILKEC